MLAERNHGARLRTPGAFGFLNDKANFVADFELIEAAIRDAVAVEIDFAAVGRRDEAVILLGDQTRDAAVVRDRMQFHVAAPLADIVFEEPASCIEQVAHRDMGIFMRMMSCRVAPDHDLAAGDGQIDTDMKQIALLMARILEFDSNVRCDRRCDRAPRPARGCAPQAPLNCPCDET